MHESILNKTILITDPITNQLIESSINICINRTSFIINYSTDKSLPHNVCLYVLLNLIVSISLKEIFTCQIINNNSSLDQNTFHYRIGPSATFLISQCIISLLMMLIICMVHTVRNKQVTTRINQYLFQKLLVRKNKINIMNADIIIENNLPLEDLVLSIIDLTSVCHNRRYTNYSLIYIKDFTQKFKFIN